MLIGKLSGKPVTPLLLKSSMSIKTGGVACVIKPTTFNPQTPTVFGAVGGAAAAAVAAVESAAHLAYGSSGPGN